MSSRTYYIDSTGSYPDSYLSLNDLWFYISYTGQPYVDEMILILITDVEDTQSTPPYYSDYYFDFVNVAGSFTIKSNIVGTKREMRYSCVNITGDGSSNANPSSTSFNFEDVIFDGTQPFALDNLGALTFKRCYFGYAIGVAGHYLNLIVINCIIDGCIGYGPPLYSSDTFVNLSTNSHNNTFINNTFSSFGSHGGVGAISDQGSNLASMIVQNNIFYDQASYYIYQATTAIVSHIDNNCFFSDILLDSMNWGNAVIGTNNLISEPYGTDPKFTADFSDYNLLPTSPCLDAGLGPDGGHPDVPTDDYDGTSRDAPTDMGAYQSPYEPIPTTTTTSAPVTTTTIEPPTTTTLTTSAPTTLPPTMDIGFVHIPWLTHKYLLLHLEDGSLFKAYIDAPLDTIYDTGDFLNKYDQICRNVSVANRDMFPDWNKFDGFKRFNGLDLEGCILELINFNPYIDFGSYFPSSFQNLNTTTTTTTTPAPTTSTTTTTTSP